MTPLETRTAIAVVAFRKAEGFTLTDDQYTALVDQMALMCADVLGEKVCNYQAFFDACWASFYVGTEGQDRDSYSAE